MRRNRGTSPKPVETTVVRTIRDRGAVPPKAALPSPIRPRVELMPALLPVFTILAPGGMITASPRAAVPAGVVIRMGVAVVVVAVCTLVPPVVAEAPPVASGSGR
ncbi:MAG: hypothetical protein ABIO94_05560 [Opitutaceae bacterium]